MAKIKNSNIIDEQDIKAFIKIIRKNWYVFLIFIMAGLIVSNFIIHKSVTTYSISTTLLLKSSENNSLKDAVLEGLGITPESDNVENDMRLITSTPIIEKTLKKLDFNISYFIEGRIKTTEVYKGIPFKVKGEIYNPDFYSVRFYIKFINQNKFNLSYVSEDNKFNKECYIGEKIATDDFSIMVEKSISETINYQSIYEINYFFIVNSFSSLVNKYLSSISVKKYEYPAAYIDINLIDEIPERGEDFLDSLGVVFLENTIEKAYQVNHKTLSFIDQLIDEVVFKLNSIESTLEQYKKQNMTLNLNEEQGQYFYQLLNVEREKSELEIQIKSLDYWYDYVITNKDISLLPPGLLEGTSMQSEKIINEYNELKKNKNILEQKTTKDNYQLKDAEKQLNQSVAGVISFLLLSKKAAQEKINQLNARIKEYEDNFRNSPKTERELINIQRQLGVNEKIYIFLLEKKAENTIAKGGIIPEQSVLEPSRNMGIVSPDKTKINLTYIGFGLGVAFLIVFIRKLFFETIDSKDDLSQFTALPIFGVIGKSKEAKENYLVVEEKPKSPVTESFRALRANFEYLAPGIDKKIILITSCMANEGKTFCASNLAAIIAKAGKKVLLIGLDMHKPKLHEAFKLPNDIGITSVLIGRTSIEKTIKNTSIDNLDVLLTGATPPNASELIFSPTLNTLINNLKEVYDFIIIDTPPIGILSDALLLMKIADINLFIIRAGTARKQFVELAHQVKENNNPKNFGFVLNDASHRNAYGYSYGYGYGYGYGQYGYGYYS